VRRGLQCGVTAAWLLASPAALTAGDRPEVVLQNGATAAMQFGAAFSGDGSLLAIGGFDTIAVWNVASRRLIRTVPASRPRALVLSGDGRLMAILTPASLVIRQTLSRAEPFELPFDKPLHVACSRDGRFIAVARENEVTLVRVGDRSTTLLARLRGVPSSLAFGSKGRYLAIGDNAGTVTIAPTSAKTKSSVVRIAVGASITALAVAPDDKRIAVATAGGIVRMFRRADRHPLNVLKMGGTRPAEVLAWGETHLTALSASGHVNSWSADLKPVRDGDLGLVNNVFSGGTASDQPLAITQDGERIAAGSGLTDIVLVDAATLRLNGRLVPVDTQVRALTVVAGHLALAAGKALLVWDLARGDITHMMKFENRINSVAFSPDGGLIGAATDRSVALWDTAHWRMRPVAHAGRTIAFSGDGAAFAAATSTEDLHGAVALFDTKSGKLKPVHRRDFATSSVAFSADGRFLASGSVGDAQVTNLASGEERTYRNGKDAGTSTIGLSGDGKLLAGADKHRVAIRDTATGDVIHACESAAGEISSVAFNDDGTRIAAAGSESLVMVWNTTDCSVTAMFRHGGGDVKSVVFLDHDRLLSGGVDGTVRLWDLRLPEPEREVMRIAILPDGEWAAVTPDGLFDGSGRALATVSWWSENATDTLPLATFFSDFYHPTLVREVFAGKVPHVCIDVATRLRIVGLRTLLSEQLAHVVRMHGHPVLCIGEERSSVPTSNLVVSDGGEPLDLTKLHWISGGPTDCATYLELPRGDSPWEVSSSETAYCPLPTTRLAGCDDASHHVARLLTVAVNDYPSTYEFGSLKGPEGDADLVSAAFHTAFIRGEAFSSVEERALRKDNATRNGILSGLRQLAAEAADDDFVFIFFSGHGVRPAGKEMFYFMPSFTEEQLARADPARVEDELGLSVADIAEVVRGIRARHIVIVVDACFSGGIVESLGRLAEIRTNGTLAVIAAATPFQRAIDDDKVLHGSPLAAALVDALMLCTANRDCSLGGLLVDTQDRVGQVIRRYLNRGTIQTPLAVAIGNDVAFSRVRGDH
jgi:WD40 repeat protein